MPDRPADPVQTSGTTAAGACPCCSSTDADASTTDAQQLYLLRRLVLACLLTMPLVWSPPAMVQLVLAGIVQFGPGMVFYRAAASSVRTHQVGMDLLVSISTSVIYAYSVVIALTQHEDVQLYFLSGCVLVCLILFGRYLEVAAKGETGRSIRGLMRLQPQQVRLERDGDIREVDASEVSPTDIVVVRAGERVPIDGRIASGTCLVDESMMTGESDPVLRHEEDELVGGTLLRDGQVRLIPTHVGSPSVLEQIIQVVERAQETKAPVQELADRIASRFVPIVLGIVVLVFLVWCCLVDPGDVGHATMIACGVLVVACPCALGLATPTSIMVGTGRAAELGVLFRDATTLEQARSADVIVFDKTGTLTSGVVVADAGTAEKNAGPHLPQVASDVVRPAAAPVVSELTEVGCEVWLMSGDVERHVKDIARETGIDEDHVLWGISPQEKAQNVARLKNGGRTVAMVGDGVNDAPALATADIGIAMGSGHDVAIESAGVVLLGGRLEAVPLALRLSDDVYHNVRQNLVWAIAYNAVAIPLAAAGLINPSIAAAAMSASSIAVLMHSLALRKAEGGTA
jgi:Cu+-exporting ATPase